MSVDDEIAEGRRFAFGDNWQRFLDVVDEQRIAAAVDSLAAMLEREDLAGLRFLDAGSGSGLFSLAASRMGASVVSFDLDPASVACTRELRRRYAADARWEVLQGSVLDRGFLAGLGEFDVVYSWGVLHHTGAMWAACDAVSERVGTDGLLFIALYNDQGLASGVWTAVKRRYNRSGKLGRAVLESGAGAYFGLRRVAGRLARKASGMPTPTYERGRGMDAKHDLRDWVGGYPFEVASPAEVFDFFRERGFSLVHMSTLSGHGCNEFVLRRVRRSDDSGC